jgi:hypothetical protein
VRWRPASEGVSPGEEERQLLEDVTPSVVTRSRDSMEYLIKSCFNRQYTRFILVNTWVHIWRAEILKI